MQTFHYQRPQTLSEAVTQLSAARDGRALAGGQTLLPAMKLRLAQPTALVDLAAIAELRGIKKSGERLTVGAMTRHVEVAESADVRGTIAALAELAGSIGDPQVRNRGTLGGSVANNDPAADYPAAVLGLDARVRTDRREIGSEQFFTGTFTTALAAGELIKAIDFRIPRRAGYARLSQPASRFALVGVLVADFGGELRVAVTGAGPGVFRAGAFEAALQRDFSPAALAAIQLPASGLNSDIHGSAAYRAHLVRVLAQRAVAAALR